MRRALVIVGKAPRPGQAKTRLVPPLSALEAAELSRAFLLDTVAVGLSLAWECVSLVHPADDGDFLREFMPTHVRCRKQVGVGLGAALRGAFEQHFAEGFERVVLIDSDSPTLPAQVLEAACVELNQHEVALGPSVDGGYYLLALRERHPELFDGIEWSTSRVYGQTVERAAGLRVVTLEEWYDVDSPADLARLEADLRQQSPATAPRTRAVLHSLTLPGAG